MLPRQTCLYSSVHATNGGDWIYASKEKEEPGGLLE